MITQVRDEEEMRRFIHARAVAGWASIGVRWPPGGEATAEEDPARESGSFDDSAPFDDSAWFDEDEESAWAAFAAVISLLPAALDAHLRRDTGMSLVELRVLSWLAAVPEHSTQMTILAEATAISQSHATRVVGRLEHRGLVRRAPGGGDRRGTVAELTEAGWDAVVGATPEYVAHVRRLVFGNLWLDQLAHLERVSRSVLEGLRPDQGLRITGKPAAFR